MAHPSSLTAYPPLMLEVLTRASTEGSVTIPCDNPQKLRLQFYGLFRALRKAKKGELADSVMITLQKNPPGLIFSRRGQDIEAILSAALGNEKEENPSSSSPDDEAFNRLFGR